MATWAQPPVIASVPHGCAGYAGIIGTCTGCHHDQMRLEEGLCKACAQAAERERGRLVAPRQERSCRLCQKPIYEPVQNQRYHPECAAEVHRLARQPAGRDYYQRQKEAR